MKTIVTHLAPDLDAIASVWLVKNFMPGWENVEIITIPAGTTYQNKPVDSDKNIVHVDTGLGKFDHHQINSNTCAARLVFEYLELNCNLSVKNTPALNRLTVYVNEIDHFQDVFYPDAKADRYEFSLASLIEGLHKTIKNDQVVIEIAFKLLDSVFIVIKNKIAAESEIKSGYIFNSRYGQSIVMETGNSDALKLAQKSGFSFTAIKDPRKGHIRIKTLPLKKYNLKTLYKKIIKVDKKGTWYLHISGHMLINGSSRNPNFIASPLTSAQLIAIIKKV